MSDSPFQRMKRAHARQRVETLARLQNKPPEEIELEESRRKSEEEERSRLERIARHAAERFSATATASLVDRIILEVSGAVKEAIQTSGVSAARDDAHEIAERVAQKLAASFAQPAQVVRETPAPAAPKPAQPAQRIPILDIERIVDFILDKEAGGQKKAAGQK
ncbi:MAG: hypothetical protein RDV41_10385 [Planctomycetota bacterium]|nr:hypothetical protein [Planctomycetota bacterium]